MDNWACLGSNSKDGGLFFFVEDFIYVFLERGEGREKEGERNINVWLPLTHTPLGTWPTNQACALTGNRTGGSLVRRPALKPLSHTSQGLLLLFIREKPQAWHLQEATVSSQNSMPVFYFS